MHSVTGTPASGGSVVDTAIATQLLLGQDSITVELSMMLVDSDSMTGASAGDVIEYEIQLTNTGTTTLQNISVSDTILNALVNR